jgi:hypothetical protein
MSMIMLSVMDVVPSVFGFPHNGYFPPELEREPLAHDATDIAGRPEPDLSGLIAPREPFGRFRGVEVVIPVHDLPTRFLFQFSSRVAGHHAVFPGRRLALRKSRAFSCRDEFA